MNNLKKIYEDKIKEIDAIISYLNKQLEENKKLKERMEEMIK